MSIERAERAPMSPTDSCRYLAQNDPDEFIAAVNTGKFLLVDSKDITESIKKSNGNKLKEFAISSRKMANLLSVQHFDEIVCLLYPDKDMLQRLLLTSQINGEDFLVYNYLKILTYDNEQFKSSPLSQINSYFVTINNLIKNLIVEKENNKLTNIHLCHFIVTFVKLDLSQPGASLLESQYEKPQRAMRVLAKDFQQTRHLNWSKKQIATLFEHLSLENIPTESIFVHMDCFRYWIEKYRKLSEKDEDKSLMPLAIACPSVFILLTNNEISRHFSEETISKIRLAALIKDAPQVKSLIEFISELCPQPSTTNMKLLLSIAQINHCYELNLLPEKWRHNMPEIIKRAKAIAQTLQRGSETLNEKESMKVELKVLRYIWDQSEESEHQLRIRIFEIFISKRHATLATATMLAWNEKWQQQCPNDYLLFRLGAMYLRIKNSREKAQDCLTRSALLGNESAALLLTNEFYKGSNISKTMGTLLRLKFKEYLENEQDENNSESLNTYCNYFLRYGLQNLYEAQFKKHLATLTNKLKELVTNSLQDNEVLSDIIVVRNNLKRFIADESVFFNEQMLAYCNEEAAKKLDALKTAKSDDAVRQTCSSLYQLYQLKKSINPNQASNHDSVNDFLIAWFAALNELFKRYIHNVFLDKKSDSCLSSLEMIKTHKDWLLLPEQLVEEFKESMQELVAAHIKAILKFELHLDDVFWKEPKKLKEMMDALFQVFPPVEKNHDSLLILCKDRMHDPFNHYFQLSNDSLTIKHVQFIYEFATLITNTSEAPTFDEKKNAADARLRRDIFRTLYTVGRWSYPVPSLKENCSRWGLDVAKCQDFSKLSLTQVQLVNVTFLPKSNFDETNFLNSAFQGCVFANCSLNQASFIKANLEGADFSFASAKNANFTDANMKGVICIGTDLTDIIISEDNAMLLLFDNLQRINALEKKYAEKNELACYLFGFLIPHINSVESLQALQSELTKLYAEGKLPFLKKQSESHETQQPAARSSSLLFGLFSSSVPSKQQNGIFVYFIKEIEDKLKELDATPRDKKSHGKK